MFLGTGGGMLRGGGGSGAPSASTSSSSSSAVAKQAHDVTAQPPGRLSASALPFIPLPPDMKHDKRGGREEAVNKRGSERSIGPNLANASVLAAIQQRAGCAYIHTYIHEPQHTYIHSPQSSPPFNSAHVMSPEIHTYIHQLAAIQHRAGHVSPAASTRRRAHVGSRRAHVASPHPPLFLLSPSSLAPLCMLSCGVQRHVSRGMCGACARSRNMCHV